MPGRAEGTSAVVCNWNGEAYLEECLASVLAQEGLDEVLLVDNASEDGSVALARERFPSVEVVELPENRGPCAARNEGLRRARNRWVLAVDNDAVLEAGVLASLRAAVEGRPDVVAAQPRSVLYEEPGRVHYDGGSFHYVGLLSLRNFYRPLSEASARGDAVTASDAIIAVCVLMDRDVVLAAGGYDEHYFYLAEDFDLALRLRQMGCGIVSVPRAIARHRGGTAGLSFRGGSYPGKRAYLHSRNRWHLIGKCYAWRTLLLAAPGILLYELVWTAFSLLRGNLRAHLAGKAAFVRELPRTLEARKAVQAMRCARDRDLLVGGPLTFSPSLVEKKAARLAARALDLCLRAWWFLVRPLCG